MQKREPCENCGKLVAPHESVSLGSIEKGYRHLCMACTNASIAERADVDFKHPEYLPMTLVDTEGTEHEFHFNTRLLGDKVAIDAFEIKNGEPRGHRFQIIDDNPEEDTFELFRRLFDRMQPPPSPRKRRLSKTSRLTSSTVLKGRVYWLSTPPKSFLSPSRSMPGQRHWIGLRGSIPSSIMSGMMRRQLPSL